MRESSASSATQEPSEAGGRFRLARLVAGPIAFAGLVGFDFAALTVSQQFVLGVTAWTAIWWITEPVPIPITSLLPALLLPLHGVVNATKAARYYSHHLILLLLGGFFIARAIEISGLHRRLALGVIRAIGDGPRQLVYGFVIAAACLSMWISNTATALMLVPIAASVVRRVAATESSAGWLRNFEVCLFLGVAYGANVGGAGSLIGTPPNLIFTNELEKFSGLTIDFRSWFVFGIPVVVIFSPLIAWMLTHVLVPVPRRLGDASRATGHALAAERAALGPMATMERRVLVVFAMAALLWVTKGSDGIPGWSHLLVEIGWLPRGALGKHVTDSAVALTMALSLFVIPRRGWDSRPILQWEDVESVPWGMLLLFGGGFAIAGAFEESGLSKWIGSQLEQVTTWPTPLLLLGIALLVTFMTEITSNTATTAILMPIFGAACKTSELHALVLMLPAVLSVSFAFMLPVATAPNAIVFATGRIPILRMLRVGFVLNLIGSVVVTGICYFWALPRFLER